VHDLRVRTLREEANSKERKNRFPKGINLSRYPYRVSIHHLLALHEVDIDGLSILSF